MNVFTQGTVRECTRRLLATATEPLTADTIADRLGTTRTQACRALRQLESQGAAIREKQAGHPGRRGGRTRSLWRSART